MGVPSGVTRVLFQAACRWRTIEFRAWGESWTREEGSAGASHTLKKLEWNNSHPDQGRPCGSGFKAEAGAWPRYRHPRLPRPDPIPPAGRPYR